MATIRRTLISFTLLVATACTGGSPEKKPSPDVQPLTPKKKASSQRRRPKAKKKRMIFSGGEMRRLLRDFQETTRRLESGDKDGTRRAARVIEGRAKKLARRQPSERLGRSLKLLQNQATLLVKTPDPARLKGLRSACVNCHRQQGLHALLPKR
ncbi:MAG: hypothetical protein JRH20_26775 [Deltaproteobacteria bacterium]|nr:hypothetical protein [Deltaproteobacteria bacterium]